MSKPRIGFVGVGIMGGPMAGHLASAGYVVTAHDIDRASVEKLVDAHPDIRTADSPKAVGENSDIVVTMLPSGRFVQECALGENGLVHGLSPGAVLLDTSSCEPWLTVQTAKELATHDIGMVDAPVSGAQVGAIKAELVFMVGGDDEWIRAVAPLLDIMGKQRFHLGPVGSGHAMKCINNLVTSVTLLATSEGLTIGKKFGLDPDVMTDVINVSTGESWVSRTHIKQRITSRKFDDPFKLGLMVKDIDIAMRLASDMGLDLPLSQQNQDMWGNARDLEGEGQSVSHLVRWLERQTGVDITPGNEM